MTSKLIPGFTAGEIAGTADAVRLIQCEEAVREAAKRGHYWVCLGFDLSDWLKSELERRGFDIQSDEGQFWIKWAKKPRKDFWSRLLAG